MYFLCDSILFPRIKKIGIHRIHSNLLTPFSFAGILSPLKILKNFYDQIKERDYFNMNSVMYDKVIF